MKQYSYIEKKYPARARSKRARENGASIAGSSSGSILLGGSNAPAGVTDHGQLTGIISTADAYSEFARDIHLTAADADTLKKVAGLEIIKSTEIEEITATDENVYSALSTDVRISQELDEFLDEIDAMYLRKDIDDTAHGLISFDKKIGSSIFLDGYDGKGWEIKETGAALLDSARIRSDIYVGNNTGSPSYASGFAGWGWQIDTPTATGEMDNLFIRKTFTAYEIVYSQIYGLGGSQIVSDLNKIARVEVMPDRYRCYMDDMDGLMLMNLRRGDGVRIQARAGTLNIKYLTGRCIKVDSDYFDIAIPLLEGTGAPAAGDFAMRWGNNENPDRQGLIYLTSSDHGAPFIDVYDGITEVSTEGKLKARLGNLKGLQTLTGDQLTGYGAYLNGVYIENSTFYTDNGETVDQRFVAMNGRFESTIEGIRNDMSLEAGNILRNSSFSENTHYWSSSNTVHFIDVANKFLWLDGSFYAEKQAVADIYRDGAKNVLRILNTTISQRNADFKGEKPDGTYSFAFYCKVLRSGTLTAGFRDKELFVSESLSVSESYQKIVKVGKWDGTGDFSIGFTGEILIYGVSLFNDALADLQIKLQTQILQTEEYIKLLATKEYVDSETGRIYTKYDASFSVMAEEIAARVTRQDFDTITGAIRTEFSSQLSVQAGNISAVSTKVDNVKNTIDTAGWINSTEGNALFATKNTVDSLTGRISTAESNISHNASFITQKVSYTDYNGQTIISKVNQTASTYQIEAKNINLTGAVTFAMFTENVQNEINGKTNLSEVNEKLTIALQNYASKDWLNFKLQSYALADSLSNYVKSDFLSNTLREYATVSNADNAASSAANTAFNKLTNALINGKTDILGGFISTQLLDVDSIYANMASIGGLEINSDGLFSNSRYTSGDISNKFFLYSNGNSAFLGFSAKNKWAGIGLNTIPDHMGGARAVARFENTVPSDRKTNHGIYSFTHGGRMNISAYIIGGVSIKGSVSTCKLALENLDPTTADRGIGYRDVFVFQPTSNMAFTLPTAAEIADKFGDLYMDYGESGMIHDHAWIEITILVTRHATAKLIINGAPGAPLVDNNGNIYAGFGNGQLPMTRGDVCKLIYYNRTWYVGHLSI